MSIGHGQGEDKAHMAIEQALHHPLLESISLEQAAGVIANFTGGSDLSLVEISEVLTNLHKQIGSQTEIVLGVTHDERLEGRAQVILVVTGLGAPTLDEVFPGVTAQLNRRTALASDPVPAAVIAPAPVISVEPVGQPVEPLNIGLSRLAANDLDVPAFLRRRARQADKTPTSSFS